jgi:RimJ/RimL family protein N-acetyltransferase
MRLEVGQGGIDEVRWLATRTGHAPTRMLQLVVAKNSSGRVRGVVGFDRWTENSCEAHIALASPIALRELAPCGFKYVFNQCGREILYAPVRGDNAPALRVVQHLGFEVEHKFQDAMGAGVPLVVFKMTKADCRYLTKPERRAA